MTMSTLSLSRLSSVFDRSVCYARMLREPVAPELRGSRNEDIQGRVEVECGVLIEKIE